MIIFNACNGVEERGEADYPPIYNFTVLAPTTFNLSITSSLFNFLSITRLFYELLVSTLHITYCHDRLTIKSRRRASFVNPIVALPCRGFKMQTLSLSCLLWLSQYIALASASKLALVERASASAVPTPISIAPSQNWYLPALAGIAGCSNLI